MSDPVEGTFTSEWDGRTVVSNPVRIDPESGRVTFVAISEASLGAQASDALDLVFRDFEEGEPEGLDREYVTVEGGGEHAVGADAEGRYSVLDLDAFRADVPEAPAPGF